jgi:hypothetical protein
MFVRMIAVALLSLFFVTEARAKEIDLRATPVPPMPTNGFCINKVTGGARLILDKDGVVAPCHRSEITVSLATLENSDVCVNKATGAMRQALDKNGVATHCRNSEIAVLLNQLAENPTPSPGASPPGSPSPDASPIATPGASPSGSPNASPTAVASPVPTVQPTVSGVSDSGHPAVTDSHGNTIGYVVFDAENVNPPGDNFFTPVIMRISGQEFIVALNASGFTTDENWNPMEVYYTSNNCTGTPYLATPSENGGITIGSTQPLVVSAAPDRSQDAYVFDGVMYYPNTAATNGVFASVQVNSMLNDATPNADGTTFRGSCTTIVDESKVFAGPLASVKLNNLGFTPPFSIPSLPAIQVRKVRALSRP